MKLVIVLVLLVVGSLVFHFLSPWWFTPIASNWTTIDLTIDITFIITGLYLSRLTCSWPTRIPLSLQPRSPRHIRTEKKEARNWLTAITAIGVAAMLAPGLVVWADFM